MPGWILIGGWFFLVLSVLVLIHELGHFLSARWLGIGVEEFGLGYPPRARVLFRRAGTIFSLNWLPFGGFIKLYGDDAEQLASSEAADPGENLQKRSSQEKKSGEMISRFGGRFSDQPAWARLVVILAGVIINFFFGIVAFAWIFFQIGIPSGVTFAGVQEGSPAQQAGIQVGDAVVALQVGAKRFSIRDDSQFITLVGQHRGQTVTLTLERGSAVLNVPVYARRREEAPEGQGALGVALGQVVLKHYPWYEMWWRGTRAGWEDSLFLSWQILDALRGMVTQGVRQGKVPSDISGPVGIVQQAHEADILSQGWLGTMRFAGALSVNLAIMNLLPIPALDGGRALFIFLELIVGRARRARWEQHANTVGFIFLLGLIFLVTAKDIWGLIF